MPKCSEELGHWSLLCATSERQVDVHRLEWWRLNPHSKDWLAQAYVAYIPVALPSSHGLFSAGVQGGALDGSLLCAQQLECDSHAPEPHHATAPP